MVRYLLNFSHPITPPQLAAIGQEIGEFELVNVKCQLDHEAGFAAQAAALIDATEITSLAFQTEAIFVNLPGLASAAATILAELHGRMGYFPTIIRLKPEPGSTPPVFVLAEIIGLQSVRDEARTRR